MPICKAGIEAGTGILSNAGREREAELIRRVREGQPEAFSELVKPHFKSLKGLVHKFVRNEFDSEDIVQQAMMKAYTCLDQFRFDATFKTWLTSIALNEIRQNARRRNNARLVFEGETLIECDLSDRGESPCELYEREESVQKLRHAIGKLPLKYRLVVEMIDLNENSLAEGHTALRISMAAAKARLFRGRRRLKMLLSESKKALTKVGAEKTAA